jgi:hypothetical protein
MSLINDVNDVNDANDVGYVSYVNCPSCGKDFKYNCLLSRHLNGKRKCKNSNKLDVDLKTLKIKLQNINNTLLVNEDKYDFNQCGFCYKNYSSRSNLKLHIKNNCKIKNNLIKQKEELQIKITNYKDHIKLPIETQNKNTKNIINNITNNTNTNINFNNLNNLNNININPFGEEDLSHITLKDYQRYISGFFPGFVEYIKKIHYADEMPANHNIYISNLNSKYAYIYKDDKWNLEKKDKLVDKLVSKKMLMLDSKCDELEKEGLLTQKNITDHEAFGRNYTNGGDESEKYLADDIMLLMYNNRDKINKNSQELIKK